jgi:hypothetical protein
MSADHESHSVAMSAYRDILIAAEQQASQAYDKTVMTLSGGALGLSITRHQKNGVMFPLDHRLNLPKRATCPHPLRRVPHRRPRRRSNDCR